MKLKWPNSNCDFDPTPALFVGCFGVYDREESLGETLNKFNPNDSEHLCVLFDTYFFSSARGFRLEHKVEIEKVLRNALSEIGHQFDKYLEGNDDECFYLPSEWEIDCARHFFEQAYYSLIKHWGSELGLEESSQNIKGVKAL